MEEESSKENEEIYENNWDKVLEEIKENEEIEERRENNWDKVLEETKEIFVKRRSNLRNGGTIKIRKKWKAEEIRTMRTRPALLPSGFSRLKRTKRDK